MQNSSLVQLFKWAIASSSFKLKTGMLYCSYTEMKGGTLVASVNGTSGATSIDDVIFTAQAIPFTFTFNGTG